MGILTPTFADKQRANGGAPHVVAAHEPLATGEMMPYAFSSPALPAEPKPAPVAESKPLKVALIGTAPSSRMLAPYGDPSWTIWACSPGNMKQIPRFDAWFEIHANLLWPEHAAYGPPYLEWLKTLTCPVYMQDQVQVPNATTFPMEELVAEFGNDFFTSSFAWMMAFAMKQGAKEIALYGIDMASRDEYILQRPGFFFFRHIARTRGITVSAPHESDIMQSPPLYGYSDSHPFGRKLAARRQEIKGRINDMSNQHAQLANNLTYLRGADEDMDYVQNIWAGVADQIRLLQHENDRLKQENQQLRLAPPG